MMKIRCLLFLFIAFFALFSGKATATLWDRGGGLIYDDVLDVTWLQDANYANTSGYDDNLYGYDTGGRMTWKEAKTWAENLVYYDPVRKVNWDDWRLPRAMPVNGDAYNPDFRYDGTSDVGYNITSPNAELAYMYYVNLGNKGEYDVNGNYQADHGLKNAGPFINLWKPEEFYGDYFYGTPFFGATGDCKSWEFYLDIGYQPWGSECSPMYAWAVRDGDVDIVPIPSVIWLFGSGLIAFGGLRKFV